MDKISFIVPLFTNSRLPSVPTLCIPLVAENNHPSNIVSFLLKPTVAGIDIESGLYSMTPVVAIVPCVLPLPSYATTKLKGFHTA